MTAQWADDEPIPYTLTETGWAMGRAITLTRDGPESYPPRVSAEVGAGGTEVPPASAR